MTEDSKAIEAVAQVEPWQRKICREMYLCKYMTGAGRNSCNTTRCPVAEVIAAYKAHLEAEGMVIAPAWAVGHYEEPGEDRPSLARQQE